MYWFLSLKKRLSSCQILETHKQKLEFIYLNIVEFNIIYLSLKIIINRLIYIYIQSRWFFILNFGENYIDFGHKKLRKFSLCGFLKKLCLMTKFKPYWIWFIKLAPNCASRYIAVRGHIPPSVPLIFARCFTFCYHIAQPLYEGSCGPLSVTPRGQGWSLSLYQFWVAKLWKI